MKTILSALLLALGAADAHAVNLSGSWKGSGIAVDNAGKTIECESVTLSIQHSAGSLTVNSSFTCGGQPISIPGGALEIRGGELFDRSGKAGNIGPDSVSITAKAKGYTMQSSASFTESRMNLQSVVSIGSNPPALSFSARLSR